MRRNGWNSGLMMAITVSATLVPESLGQCWRVSLQKYVASDGTAGDELGSDVAIDGGALVGVPGDDDGGTSSGSPLVLELT